MNQRTNAMGREKPRRIRPRPQQFRPEAEPRSPRPMCFCCLRPADRCHCGSIPVIDNRTEILLLQDIRERSHPFNTARMVNRALQNSRLVPEFSDRIGEHAHLIAPGAALLYPSARAVDIASIATADRPEQLVLLDGTWNQVKRLYRYCAALHDLPHYKLSPRDPGQYRIRLEPDRHSLSTVEATVAALKIVEPETGGLDDLLQSFAIMVERQLAHPKACYESLPIPRPQKVNVPHAIGNAWPRLVVAYGEAAPLGNEPHCTTTRRPPVYWVAMRVATGEKFQVAIESKHKISDGLLEHFELTREHFSNAASTDRFRDQWQDFSRADDIVVVYNASTLRLLTSIGIDSPHSIELKSINFHAGESFPTLAAFFASRNIPLEPLDFPGRAGRRLANVATLVQHLRTMRAR